MKKITLKIFDDIELETAFDFAKKCVINFITEDYKHCVYTNAKENKSCFVYKGKTDNLIVTIRNETC
jgi:hypothetical protein